MIIIIVRIITVFIFYAHFIKHSVFQLSQSVSAIGRPHVPSGHIFQKSPHTSNLTYVLPITAKHMCGPLCVCAYILWHNFVVPMVYFVISNDLGHS